MTFPVLPSDIHNARLVANVHPAEWVNPVPAPRYNLVVLGAGTAGLVTAAGAAGLGAKVALVERELMDATARLVIRNALFWGRAKASAQVLPWCTYTDPEVAHVGLSEREAKDKGIQIRIFLQELRDVDRAILDGETEGFVKVLTRAGSSQILGATIVAAHAGEMISEVTLAMVARVGLQTIAETIHPYPTQGGGNQEGRGCLQPQAPDSVHQADLTEVVRLDALTIPRSFPPDGCSTSPICFLPRKTGRDEQRCEPGGPLL